VRAKASGVSKIGLNYRFHINKVGIHINKGENSIVCRF